MTFWRAFMLISLILGISYSLLGYFRIFNLTIAVALVSLVVTAVMSAITFKISQKNAPATQGYIVLKGFLSSLGIKLLITISIIVFVKLKFPEIVFPFVGCYFFSYFIYTTLAVYYLFRNLRPQTGVD